MAHVSNGVFASLALASSLVASSAAAAPSAHQVALSIDRIGALRTTEGKGRRDEVYFLVLGKGSDGSTVSYRVPESGAKLSRPLGGQDYYGLHAAPAPRGETSSAANISLFRGVLPPGQSKTIIVTAMEQENDQAGLIQAALRIGGGLLAGLATGGVGFGEVVRSAVELGGRAVRSLVSSRHKRIGTLVVHLQNGPTGVVSSFGTGAGSARTGGKWAFRWSGAGGLYDVAASVSATATGGGFNQRAAQTLATKTERCGGRVVRIASGALVAGPPALTGLRTPSSFRVSSPVIAWTCDGSRERTTCPSGTSHVVAERGLSRLLTLRCMRW